MGWHPGSGLNRFFGLTERAGLLLLANIPIAHMACPGMTWRKNGKIEFGLYATIVFIILGLFSYLATRAREQSLEIEKLEEPISWIPSPQ